ncbi:hypothetical protein [Natrinema sp. H-ect4]|uniref:hypothetical protein n=1 Tax=Natrinema sp. H-ect4 TaxID=3242699 RepID=UPI0035A88DF3
MAQVEEVLDDAIDMTAASFLDHPANISDERSLAEEVRLRLCTVLSQVSVEEVLVKESSKAQGSITDHEDYTSHYRKTEEIDRAQCEIGGPAFPFGGSERLDLGVFSDGLTITVDNGTQEFDPADLAAAVEFKYVKNINYLRYRPDDDKSKYRDIADDISRLGELPERVDRRCIVFSNYDLLRRDSDRVAEENLRELAGENGVDLRFVLPGPV